MKTTYRGACVQIYLAEKDFIEAVKWAEKVKKRRVGLFLKVQRKGRNGLKAPSYNTKGLAKAYKFYFAYYREHEYDRLREEAEIAEQEKALLAKKKKLGL